MRNDLCLSWFRSLPVIIRLYTSLLHYPLPNPICVRSFGYRPPNESLFYFYLLLIIKLLSLFIRLPQSILQFNFFFHFGLSIIYILYNSYIYPNPTNESFFQSFIKSLTTVYLHITITRSPIHHPLLIAHFKHKHYVKPQHLFLPPNIPCLPVLRRPNINELSM
jgi:hypothetical protein